MIRTKDTYRQLRKVYTGTYKEVVEIINHLNVFPSCDLVTCTRGNNEITYYRPFHGEYINDKVWMIHFNGRDNVTLYL